MSRAITKLSVLGLVLGLVVFASGCSGYGRSAPVDPDLSYAGTYRSYRAVNDEWTRRGKVYTNFETELVIDATFYAKPYRDALRAEKARAELLPPSEIAELQKKDELELEQMVFFFVSAYTPNRTWNNLNKDEPSFRLWLIDVDGRQVAPTRIQRVSLQRKADLLYHPPMHNWAKTYEVSFPRHDEEGNRLRLSGGDVKFVAAGVQGNAELVWQIP
ncbi:MAG: hypothetical protein H6683_07095 [Deltaproteobacteria bacterium]|nr:hypothetical protein [Deltaproteobacteria bacterium]